MKSKKPTVRYMVDFETNSQPGHPLNNVYLWEKLEIKPPYQNKKLGINVIQLLNTIGQTNEHEIWYFHNLNFDGHFLLEWLCKKFKPIPTDNKLENNSFKIYMNNFNSIYAIQILSWGCLILILDSYKILAQSVSKLGKKLELDYDKYYQFKTIDEVPIKMLEYLHTDCQTVAEYLYQFNSKKWTKSGYAIESLENFIDPEIWKKYYELEINDDLIEIGRKSYKGGFCNINQNYQSQLLNHIYGYDINSSYPFIMTRKIVCGLPDEYDQQPIYNGQNRYLLKVFIRKAVIKKTSPCAIISTNQILFNAETNYFNKIEYQTFYVWRHEFEFWKKFYNLQFKIKKWYEFSVRDDFKEWINDLYVQRKLSKINGDKINNLILKNTMNSAYGKMAERNIHQSKILKLCNNDCFNHYLFANKYCFYLKNDEKTTLRNIFTASYITSEQRCRLFDIINKINNDFVYCDTDSVYSKSALDKVIKIDPNNLGDWKQEFFGDFKAIKQKCYIKSNDDINSDEFGKIKIVMAGATQNLKDKILKTIDYDLNKFKLGLKIKNGNIKMNRNRYGIIFENYDYQIENYL